MEGDIRMPSTSTHARAKRPKGSGRSLLQSEEKYIIYKIYNLIKELAENPESVTMIDFSKVPHLTIQMCGIPSVTVKDVCEKASMSKEKILKSSDSRKHCNFYIYNTFKFLKELAEHPEKIASVDFRKSQGLTAELCGISMRTVQRVCKEASVSTEPSPKFSSPRITVKRKCYVTALSDSEKDIIRSEINDFTKDGECPTRAKLREILRDKVGYSGSLTSVARIVKDLGLEYRKYDGKRVLMQVRTSPVASSEYITVDIETDTSSSVSETLSSEESSHSDDKFEDPIAFLDELRHTISSAVNMPSSTSMCSANFDPKLDIVASAPINFAVQITDREEAPSTFALLNETSNNSVIQTLLFQEHNSGDRGERLSNVDEVSLSSTARIEPFISNHALLDVDRNDPAIQELDNISCKVNQIDVYDDVFESFGRYIASLLRSLPNRRGMELQQEIINLVLKSYVSAWLKYNESVVCSTTANE